MAKLKRSKNIREKLLEEGLQLFLYQNYHGTGIKKIVRNTLQWRIQDRESINGSQISDWKKIEGSVWQNRGGAL